jgi:acyl carrier protein
MEPADSLKSQIKALLIENLMLQMTAVDIRDDQALFGPGSLGLDSVDALQIVVALDKAYGLKIADQTEARQILQNVNTITQAVENKLAGA